MSLLKSAYRLLGITYLDKSERMVIKESGRVKFKCSHCNTGTTESIKEMTLTEKKFPLFCDSCGSYGEYFIKGSYRPAGLLLREAVYNYYQVQKDGTLKFIGG